jgi:hypothetical protein
MKKDVVLVVAVIIILYICLKSFIQIQIGVILKILCGLFIFGLFLYKQIKPHKSILFPQHLKWFSYIEKVFDWIFKFIHLKPVKLGNALSIDASALLVLIVFILLLII